MGRTREETRALARAKYRKVILNESPEELEARQERRRVYYQANKAIINARSQEYYAVNKKQLAVDHKAFRDKQ